jgi:predicted transcriptional regulator
VASAWKPVGATLFLYPSTPDRAILGTVRLTAIERPNVQDVWHLYPNEIEVGEEALSDYLTAAESAVILRVNRPLRWRRSIPLALLRSALGIEPSQSFRYLRDAQVVHLERLRDRTLETEHRTVRTPPRIVA